MRIALVQIASPEHESFSERLGRIERLLLDLDPTVDFVLLPELWGVGYMYFDRYAQDAEPLDGPTVAMARRVASALDATVHIGSIVERTPTGDLRNTSVVVAADGSIVHTFSKIHIFGYESRETELLTPGDSLVVVDTPFGKLAGTTCYDVRFPGLWQELSDRGAEVVAIPAAWPAARREHWRLMTQARALEHQLWIFACNAVGDQGGVVQGGFSRVVAPNGEVVTEADDSEGVTYADIDETRVTTIRAEFPVIADRISGYRELSTSTTSGASGSTDDSPTPASEKNA